MKEIVVTPIRNGTVIDHIPPANAVKVLVVLGVPRPGSHSVVSVAMNVDTKRFPGGLKDIVKIEDRELDKDELNTIAAIAPDATISIIRNYEVAKKFKVKEEAVAA